MIDVLKAMRTDADSARPAWLRFIPAEVRGLVEAHLPAGLPDFADFRLRTRDSSCRDTSVMRPVCGPTNCMCPAAIAAKLFR
jgi:hypothetical protein